MSTAGQPPSPTMFSVVILTRDRAATLVKAVASALEQEYDSFEVVVVDNGSNTSVESVLLEAIGDDDRLRVVRSGKNLGAAGGRNFGGRHARGAILVFLDDDAVLLDPSTLSYTAKFMGSRSGAGALQYEIVSPEREPLYPSSGIADARDPNLIETNYLVTAGCAVRRSAHFAAEGFPEPFEIYYEDNYYAFAMIMHGFRIYRTAAISVEHPAHEPRHGRDPVYYFNAARNLNWLYLRFFPLRAALPPLLRVEARRLREAWRHRHVSHWARGMLAGALGAGGYLRMRPKFTSAQIKYVLSLERRVPVGE
jgi:GT2 family glycosyltransferase